MANRTLLELNTFIRRCIALNASEPVWVSAEIAEAKYNRGHYYLGLVHKADNSDQIVASMDAVLWEGQARKLAHYHSGLNLVQLLQTGMAVALLVQVDYHERYGMKLVVQDIDPDYSVGQMALKREQTLAQLRTEGLLERNKSLDWPLVPQRLAVITSAQAAGWQDFEQQLQRNAHGYRWKLTLLQAAMQGEQASAEIRRQLGFVARRAHEFDAVVILRGGGARLDLGDFDDLALCRAAAECPLPIVTGIGHDVDTSILDLVAYHAAPTPTAAAHYFVGQLLEVERWLVDAAHHTARMLQMAWQKEAAKVGLLAQRAAANMTRNLQTKRWQLQQWQERAMAQCRMRLKMEEQQLGRYQVLLEATDVQRLLDRGFVILQNGDKRLKSIQELTTLPQELTIRFADGKRHVLVQVLPDNPQINEQPNGKTDL